MATVADCLAVIGNLINPLASMSSISAAYT